VDYLAQRPPADDLVRRRGSDVDQDPRAVRAVLTTRQDSGRGGGPAQ
jgi:hypothetical protein